MVYNRIVRFMDFVQRPELSVTIKHKFRKLDLIPSSSEEREIPTLFTPLERTNLI
jgi:hypothetical protein